MAQDMRHPYIPSTTVLGDKCLKHEGNKMLHHNIDHQIAFINFTKVGGSIMFFQVLVISTSLKKCHCLRELGVCIRVFVSRANKSTG